MADSDKHWCFGMHPSDAPGACAKVKMQTLDDLIDPKLEQEDAVIGVDWDHAHGAETGNLLKESGSDHYDARRQLDLALRQAFVNTMVELTKRVHATAIEKRAGAQDRTVRGVPKAWTYKVTRPVVVDCREWLRSLSLGKTRKLMTVQIPVRGHWKNQRCGPGGTERKFIHIEPYWRGPEDAPIAVRSHVLTGPRQKPSDGQSGSEAAE
jgi:hypothetical protein